MAVTQVTDRQKVDLVVLTSEVTGVLPVANGGTNSNTLVLNTALLGNGSGAVQQIAPGASGNVLTSNGTTWASTLVGTGRASITADTAALNITETLVTSMTIPTAVVGTVYRISISGTCTSSVANASTFTIRAGTLGTTGDASIGTVAITSAASGTSIPFFAHVYLTVRTTGATGGVVGMLALTNNGTTGIATTATAVVAVTPAALFNTTTATKLSITYKSAAVTTTTTFQTAVLEIVKP